MSDRDARIDAAIAGLTVLERDAGLLALADRVRAAAAAEHSILTTAEDDLLNRAADLLASIPNLDR